MMWSMISSLQLIVSLPFFGANMPANAKYFYGHIERVVEFAVLPSAWVGENIFRFEEGTPFNLDFEMMDIF